MDGKVAALKIQEAPRTAEIVQQMAIDMEQIGIIADMGDDVLVPDFGQQRTAGLFQWPVLLLVFMAGGIRRGPAALHGLLFRPQPRRIKAQQAAGRLGP
jgi:hypothetical protein